MRIGSFDATGRIQQSGTAILMTGQDARAALRIADRVCVLEHGRVGRAGTSRELASDDRIRQACPGID